jgi:hypothetical protein
MPWAGAKSIRCLAGRITMQMRTWLGNGSAKQRKVKEYAQAITRQLIRTALRARSNGFLNAEIVRGTGNGHRL